MSSIRLATAANVRGFQSLSNALNTSDGRWAGSIDHEALGDEFGRFRVWSGNLGALQKGHSSLDYRLRDSPLLSENTLKFLKELEDNLNEAYAVVSGIRLPYESQQVPEPSEEDEEEDDFFSDDDDDSSSQSKTELDMRFGEIVDIVDNLYKLSVRIRTPTIRSRSLKAASYQPKDPETGIDILSMYAEYDCQHTKELLSHLRKHHEQEIQGDNDFLAARLSKSITLRRRQFMYWKRHRDKLAISTVPEEEDIVHMQPPLERSDSDEANVIAGPLLSPDIAVKEAPSQKTRKTMLSGTEATHHNQSLDNLLDTKSVTSYAVTVKDIHGKGIDLPPPPKAADGERDFECPYCYIICPARYGSGRPWRTHLLQDLQPYVCTYETCEASEQLFRSRREWVEHEASHRKAWRCPEHLTAVYGSRTGLEDHLRQEHADSIPASQLNAVVNIGETSTVDLRNKCPICLVSADTEGMGDLQNHIANHLERFATFALPIGNEEDADGASSAASRGRSGSSASQDVDEMSLPSDTSDSELSDEPIIQEEGDQEVPASQSQLSADSLNSLPDASGNRLAALLSQSQSGDDAESQEAEENADDKNDQLDSAIHNLQPTVGDKMEVLTLSEIPTLRQLYRSRKLTQRDYEFDANDSYNRIISFCHHDLTKLKVDAIVNSANNTMTDSKQATTLNNTIHKLAGPQFTKEAKSRGKLKSGEVRLTSGHRLPCANVIHAARPAHYKPRSKLELDALSKCYRSTLELALGQGFKSVAFPCLGTGGCGFPPRVAACAALQEAREFLESHPDHPFERIVFVVNTSIDKKAYLDTLPVFFPPTPEDLEAAGMSVWSADRSALCSQVFDVRTQINKTMEELAIEFSSHVPDFPNEIFSGLRGIGSSLTSIRAFLVGPEDLKTSLEDLHLICTVMQHVCGSIAEIIELAKGSIGHGDGRHRAIWGNYNTHMKGAHRVYLAQFFTNCQTFVQYLDDIFTRGIAEPTEMATIRQQLESYRAKQKFQDTERIRDRLDEVPYTRTHQREGLSTQQNVVRLHQIPSLHKLYQQGQLEEKPTTIRPSVIFNHTVCFAKGDITDMDVTIMVTSTDAHFSGFGSLDRLVMKKGGVELVQACRSFGACDEGDVRITPGYLLPARHVFHAIPPVMYDEEAKNVLRDMYREILHTAASMRATSIAIPGIGTGSLNYPRRDSASIALEEVRRYLETAGPSSTLESIVFVAYTSAEEFIYKLLLPIYFPPVKVERGTAVRPSTPVRANTSRTSVSETTSPPRRSLFGSIGDAFRNINSSQPSTKRPIAHTSRTVDAYEENTLTEFEVHAQDCVICKDMDQLYVEGHELCPEGLSLAKTVMWYMTMSPDEQVYTRPVQIRQSVRLEVPENAFPLSLKMLSLAERSLREEGREKPFVTPDRQEYPAVTPSKSQEDLVVTKIGTSTTATAVGLRAHVMIWSTMTKTWIPISPGECKVSIQSGRVEVYKLHAPPSTQEPLLSLELSDMIGAEGYDEEPGVIIEGKYRLPSSNSGSEGIDGRVLLLSQNLSRSQAESLIEKLRQTKSGFAAPTEGPDNKEAPAAEEDTGSRSVAGSPASRSRSWRRGESTSSIAWGDPKDSGSNTTGLQSQGRFRALQSRISDLSQATFRLKSKSPQLSPKEPLSPLAEEILSQMVADHGPSSPFPVRHFDDIASSLQKSPTMVSAALKELEAQGHVQNTGRVSSHLRSPREVPLVAEETKKRRKSKLSFAFPSAVSRGDPDDQGDV